MADTIESLKEDIEKRMVALGYEDFEELHSPDHDLKSLKELKRRIMDEAKELKEKKKELTKDTKAFRDFLVKLTKIYRKDFYLYNGTFLIPGKISTESLKGKYLLKVKEDLIPLIQSILQSEGKNEMLYIPDIALLKNLVDELIERKELIRKTAEDSQTLIVVPEEKTTSLLQHMNEELEHLKKDSNEFLPLEIDLSDEEILSIKKIFPIQYKDYPKIEVNVQVFPFFTEKTQNFMEFMCGKVENSGLVKIYYAWIHIDHEYFDIYFKLYYF